MRAVWKVITFPIRAIAYLLIGLYKFCISPFFSKTCIYYPTCSKYMFLAIREYGVIKGISLGVKRLLRCNPKHKGGEDYLPLNLKGDKKWIF